MRRIIAGVVIGVFFASAPLPAQPVAGPAKAKATTAEIPFESVPNFFKLPAGLYMGEGVGVATNSKGNVYVYVRSGETRLFEFDKSGAFVKEFGVGSYGFSFAHAVRVDKDDNVWAVDEGTNIIQKFSPDGKLLMVLGKRPDPLEQLAFTPGGGQYSGANRPYSFHRQTDIGWDPQGNIFVSDGYGDSRVVKYDKNGRFVKSVGGARGSAPSMMNTPHSITSDAQGNIYVGDRGNARVQVFDNDLTLRAIYDNVGNPWAVCISPGPHQYLFVSNSNPDSNPAASWAITGEIYKMELDGTIVGKFGKAGKGLGEFSTVHEIDCRNPDQLFVSEISAWRAQKIILNPQKPTTAAGAK
jgi:hypothetical protein